MDHICFSVVGEPKGKGRPRFSFRSHRAYTPNDTVAYENEVKRTAKKTVSEFNVQNNTAWNLAANYCVRINAVFRVPMSWSKRKRAAAFRGEIRPSVKPDIDNISKAVLDGMNGVVYGDDSLVSEMSVRKAYQMTDEDEPRVEVEVICE